MAVGRAPVGHAVLADRLHDVGDQVEVVVQRDDRALVGQHALAVAAAGMDHVGQVLDAVGQRGGDLRAVVAVGTPVDVKVHAGQLLDAREVVAAVELGRILVEVHAHRGDGHATLDIEGLARLKVSRLPPLVGQSAQSFRKSRHRGQQHRQGERQGQELFHGTASFSLYSHGACPRKPGLLSPSRSPASRRTRRTSAGTDRSRSSAPWRPPARRCGSAC